MFIDTNYQGNNPDGTFENPYTGFLDAFENLNIINQTENLILITHGNIINDFEVPFKINFPLKIMAFGFESQENAKLNTYLHGSFQIFENLLLKKLTISLHNSVQITSFILLMENASLIMEVLF